MIRVTLKSKCFYIATKIIISVSAHSGRQAALYASFTNK